MTTRRVYLFVALGVLGAVALGAYAVGDRTLLGADPPKPAAVRPKGKPAADKEREADRAAIREAARAFVEAFEKGDAKAVAAAWTEHAEYYDDQGTVLHGRAAIEDAYRELFKENSQNKLEVEIESIRFPSRDTAIEEGVLRMTHAGAELPTSTRYSVLHAREDGQWKMAISREWGAGESKLEDLAWLIGDWKANSKDREVHLRFEWNEAKTLIQHRFSVKAGGVSVASGEQTIRVDPQSGQLYSSAIDDEGGQGDSFWHRDGNRWVLDSAGVLADGGQTTATDVITRLNDDEFVRRSLDRTLDGERLVDAEPVKLTRVKAER